MLPRPILVCPVILSVRRLSDVLGLWIQIVQNARMSCTLDNASRLAQITPYLSESHALPVTRAAWVAVLGSHRQIVLHVLD
jgi:hypothetical protein